MMELMMMMLVYLPASSTVTAWQPVRLPVVFLSHLPLWLPLHIIGPHT